jgi:hypothetical protein
VSFHKLGKLYLYCIQKESVYLISICSLLDTTVLTIVKNLTKRDRLTLKSAQIALMTVCVDMGMK